MARKPSGGALDKARARIEARGKLMLEAYDYYADYVSTDLEALTQSLRAVTIDARDYSRGDEDTTPADSLDASIAGALSDFEGLQGGGADQRGKDGRAGPVTQPIITCVLRTAYTAWGIYGAYIGRKAGPELDALKEYRAALREAHAAVKAYDEAHAGEEPRAGRLKALAIRAPEISEDDCLRAAEMLRTYPGTDEGALSAALSGALGVDPAPVPGARRDSTDCVGALARKRGPRPDPGTARARRLRIEILDPIAATLIAGRTVKGTAAWGILHGQSSLAKRGADMALKLMTSPQARDRARVDQIMDVQQSAVYHDGVQTGHYIDTAGQHHITLATEWRVVETCFPELTAADGLPGLTGRDEVQKLFDFLLGIVFRHYYRPAQDGAGGKLMPAGGDLSPRTPCISFSLDYYRDVMGYATAQKARESLRMLQVIGRITEHTTVISKAGAALDDQGHVKSAFLGQRLTNYFGRRLLDDQGRPVIDDQGRPMYDMGQILDNGTVIVYINPQAQWEEIIYGWYPLPVWIYRLPARAYTLCNYLLTYFFTVPDSALEPGGGGGLQANVPVKEIHAALMLPAYDKDTARERIVAPILRMLSQITEAAQAAAAPREAPPVDIVPPSQAPAKSFLEAGAVTVTWRGDFAAAIRRNREIRHHTTPGQ